jgi:SAM-dependent methyltransferase
MHPAQDPYDAVAYPNFSNPETHPDRLATMAILHGLSPAPVEQCRVLEVACNQGANLIPMAYAIPKSEFVGFDLARLPVERAHQRIREIGLTNIRIFQSDLLDVGAELGRFDYIIAHGLYAWVPKPVSDRLLALCGELLAPEGVAFVSYNALPGGHVRNMIRDMMLYQAKDIEDPHQRVAAGVDFLNFWTQARPAEDAYRQLIEKQLKKMEKAGTQVTCHDELAGAYHPAHFFEFVEHARKHGLQYLSEAALPPATDPCYRTDILSALENLANGDLIKQEQMLDFLRMRMYRETLLCRQERGVRRDFAPECLSKLLFASQTESGPGEEPGSISFKLPGGIKMESNHPAAIALLETLGAVWPRALSFAEIKSRLQGTGFALDAKGITLVIRLVVTKMMELRSWNAPVALEISTQPRATLVSRQEALTQAFATNLLHTKMGLDDPVIRCLLGLLDGARDRDQLLAALKAEFPSKPPEELAAGIEPGLRTFYRAGLLEA